ncbi:hypothetical protein JG688_00016412 [Phytophthora aleatoria]|uniref:Uncharacterized protein n=1 Tax=Phytophthora aleatoria TaxID=2496075 RepID=A0A8J5IS20_9STRA|nr:hypothetical protein JG688_00016412 [Phytophthora aleatoria]
MNTDHTNVLACIFPSLMVWQSREKKIVNVVAPFPQATIKSWAEFDTIFAAYKKANNLHFCVRSSELAATYNRYVNLKVNIY